MATKVTITRQMRDVLIEHVRDHRTGQFEGFDEILRIGDRDEVHRMHGEIEEILALLEQLDAWDNDPAGETYELTLAPWLRPWISEQCADTAEMIDYEENILARQQAGDSDWIEPYTAEMAIAESERWLVKGRRDLSVLTELAWVVV